MLQQHYDIPELSKKSIIKGMADIWRRLKFELRRDYYDMRNTHEERILNLPPGIKEEDWKVFCDNENTPEAQQRRIDHKRKREKYTTSHTTGRTPHSVVRANLVCLLNSHLSIFYVKNECDT